MLSFFEKKHRSRILFFSIFIFSLFGCSKQEQGHAADIDHYTRPSGWKTICLGRILIDLPPSAQLGGAETRFKGSYGFRGINTGNAWGKLNYGNISILETVKTNNKGFQNIRRGAQVRITSAEYFKNQIKARQDDLDYILESIAESSPEDASGYAGILKSRKDAVQEVIKNSKMTGEAKLSDSNGFAVRYGPGYVLGFIDPQDQRVRMFSSENIKSKNDSVQGVAEEYQTIRNSYHTRAPTDIPVTPGFCTYYGFIDEPKQPELQIKMRVPIQIEQFPNLIFALDMEPADPEGPPNIQKFPDMDAGRNDLDKIGVKRRHGPKAVQILGAPGRSYAQEYGDNCSSTSCRPADQLYDMEARTFGEPGRVDRPRLILHLTAATSDDYKLKRPAEPKGFNVPDRPALSGHVPPSFEVGQEMFEQVLRSIRPRSGAIAEQRVSAATSDSDQRR